MVSAAQVGFLMRFVLPGIAAGESVLWVLGPSAIVFIAGMVAVVCPPHSFIVRTDGSTVIRVWRIGAHHEFRRGRSQFELLNRRRLRLSSADGVVVFTPDISGFRYLKSIAREWANSEDAR